MSVALCKLSDLPRDPHDQRCWDLIKRTIQNSGIVYVKVWAEDGVVYADTTKIYTSIPEGFSSCTLGDFDLDEGQENARFLTCVTLPFNANTHMAIVTLCDENEDQTI